MFGKNTKFMYENFIIIILFILLKIDGRPSWDNKHIMLKNGRNNVRTSSILWDGKIHYTTKKYYYVLNIN